MNYPDPDVEELTNIPKPIREQLLHNQWTLVDVSSTWDLIDQIYGEKENVALLRRASAYGYDVIYHVLWEHCILAISRLADPPQIAGKRNLTLLSLQKEVEIYADTALLDKTNIPFKELLALVAGCKQFRHKILAHNDYKTALGQAEQPHVKVREISDFISRASGLISSMRDHFGVRHFCFDMIVGADATGIVKSLQALEQFRKLRNDVVRSNLPDLELRKRLQQIRPL